MASIKLILVCALLLVAVSHVYAGRIFLLDDGTEDQEAAESVMTAHTSGVFQTLHPHTDVRPLYSEQRQSTDNFETLQNIKIYHDPHSVNGAVSTQNFVKERPPDNESLIIKRIIDTDSSEGNYVVALDKPQTSANYRSNWPSDSSMFLSNDNTNSRFLRLSYSRDDSRFLPVEHRTLQDGIELNEESIQDMNNDQWNPTKSSGNNNEGNIVAYKQSNEISKDKNVAEYMQKTSASSRKPIIVPDFTRGEETNKDTRNQQLQEHEKSQLQSYMDEQSNLVDRQNSHYKGHNDSQHEVYKQSNGETYVKKEVYHPASPFTSSSTYSYGSSASKAFPNIPEQSTNVVYGSQKSGSLYHDSYDNTYGSPQNIYSNPESSSSDILPSVQSSQKDTSSNMTYNSPSNTSMLLSTPFEASQFDHNPNNIYTSQSSLNQSLSASQSDRTHNLPSNESFNSLQRSFQNPRRTYDSTYGSTQRSLQDIQPSTTHGVTLQLLPNQLYGSLPSNQHTSQYYAIPGNFGNQLNSFHSTPVVLYHDQSGLFHGFNKQITNGRTFTFVKTDSDANVKWGVHHNVGSHYPGSHH